jgi:RNA polymerase sigma-70 factor (ECF subfamily)
VVVARTEPAPEFEVLYLEHAPRVLAFCLRRADRATAEDAMAETFAVAWRRRHDVPHPPLPWLLGVARRALANQRRAAQRQERLGTRLAAVPRAEPAEESDAHVYEALRALRARDREVLILTAWDELSAAEAAEVFGCSPTAYRIRLHRARRRFARLLAEEGQAEARPAGSRPVDLSVEEMTS